MHTVIDLVLIYGITNLVGYLMQILLMYIKVKLAEVVVGPPQVCFFICSYTKLE